MVTPIRSPSTQENIACKGAFEMVNTCEDTAPIDMVLGQAMKDLWADAALQRVSSVLDRWVVFHEVSHSLLLFCADFTVCGVYGMYVALAVLTYVP